MAKSIPAIITPEVLKWARGLDGITVNEIAKNLRVKVEQVEAWERGDTYPSLLQAKNYAKICHVPFVFFYLPDTPQKIKRLDKIDYRTFGNGEITEMSLELRWFLRDVEERRDAMIELYREAGVEPDPLTLTIAANTSKEVFASSIRNFLSLNDDVQIRLRKPENALSYCISNLEKKDFLVFQAAKIQPNEMRGLSIAYDTFPIIALNRKDEQSARLFTLVHELVHILSRTSGICNDIGKNKVVQNQVELFCNEIAGLALVPTIQLKQNKHLLKIQKYGLDDSFISAIARDFAVSREVILHRLWDIDIITKAKYYELLHKYSVEYLAKKKKDDGFIPPALDKGTQVGKLYTKTVLSAFFADRLSPREASNYLLGLNVKHFGAIERWCF